MSVSGAFEGVVGHLAFDHAGVAASSSLGQQAGQDLADSVEQGVAFDRTNGFAYRITHVLSTMDARSARVLTSREHAVFVQLSSPQSLEELASHMSVSVNTVKTHVRAIYAKLGVNSRHAAVIAGRQLGLN